MLDYRSLPPLKLLEMQMHYADTLTVHNNDCIHRQLGFYLPHTPSHHQPNLLRRIPSGPAGIASVSSKLRTCNDGYNITNNILLGCDNDEVGAINAIRDLQLLHGSHTSSASLSTFADILINGHPSALSRNRQCETTSDSIPHPPLSSSHPVSNKTNASSTNCQPR